MLVKEWCKGGTRTFCNTTNHTKKRARGIDSDDGDCRPEHRQSSRHFLKFQLVAFEPSLATFRKIAWPLSNQSLNIISKFTVLTVPICTLYLFSYFSIYMQFWVISMFGYYFTSFCIALIEEREINYGYLSDLSLIWARLFCSDCIWICRRISALCRKSTRVLISSPICIQ